MRQSHTKIRMTAPMRRRKILRGAAEELMTVGYDSITVTSIARRAEVSRATVLSYYGRKAAVFVDLMILEYEEIGQELLSEFCAKTQRDAFCRSLVKLLWQHQPLLKLLSMQPFIKDPEYDDALAERLVRGMQPYVLAMDEILLIQFPDASELAKNLFKIQFFIYSNSLYDLDRLPASQMTAINELNCFKSHATGMDIFYEALMMLSATLEG